MCHCMTTINRTLNIVLVWFHMKYHALASCRLFTVSILYEHLIRKSIRLAHGILQTHRFISTMTNVENSFKIPCIFKLSPSPAIHLNTWKTKGKTTLTYWEKVSRIPGPLLNVCVVFFSHSQFCSASDIEVTRNLFSSLSSVQFNSWRMEFQISP